MTGEIGDYLASDEAIEHAWEGEITDDSGSHQGTLALTDRRVVYLMGSSFKDVEYSHITSVETEVEEPPDVNISLLFKGVGVAALAVGILAIVLDLLFSFVAMTLGGLGLIGFGIAFDRVDMEEHGPDPTHTISIITGDESDQELTFETNENVGAEISRTVR